MNRSSRSLKTCCWLLSVTRVPRLWRPGFLALPCHAQNHFTSYVYELRAIAIAISTISSSFLHRQVLSNASIGVRDVLNYLSFYTSCAFLIQTRAPSTHTHTHTHRTYTHTHTHTHAHTRATYRMSFRPTRPIRYTTGKNFNLVGLKLAVGGCTFVRGDYAPLGERKLGPHLTQCGLDRGPPPCQVSS